MRSHLFLLALLFFSCKSATKEERLINILEGDWVILYPEDQLKNEEQRMLYGKIQDSVVSKKSLKLVSFFEGGVFSQIDDLAATGRWDVKDISAISIQEGGEGFENFKTNFMSYQDNMLQLSETIHYDNDDIRLIWHIKKVDTKTSNKLFSRESNSWRKKPKEVEANNEIKKRLATILLYYADYYTWVAEESSFFIGKRIMLPFEFYQHAIGTKDFDTESDFAKLFFDQQQAEKAYEYLQDVITVLRNDFEKKSNYVKGYANHMSVMARKIVELP